MAKPRPRRESVDELRAKSRTHLQGQLQSIFQLENPGVQEQELRTLTNMLSVIDIADSLDVITEHLANRD